MRCMVLAFAVAFGVSVSAERAVQRFIYRDLKNIGAVSGNLSQLKGRPLLVVFWAVWCEPCEREMPQLTQLYEKFGPQGIEFAGIAVNSPAAAAEKFLARNQIRFANFLDPSSEFAETLAIPGVPTLLLVHPDGRIVYSHSGDDLPLTDLTEQIRLLLKQKHKIKGNTYENDINEEKAISTLNLPERVRFSELRTGR